MHFRSKAQAPHGRQPSHQRHPAERVPSAAWLAAQEAFSAPRPEFEPAPRAEPAVVVVRKARAPGAGPASAFSPAGAQAVQADKPARVFRVLTTGPALPDVAVAPVATPAAGQAELAGEAPAAAPLARAPRRKRRVDLDKRPGPVLLVQAAPAPTATVPQAPSLSASEQMAALAALMAHVNAVLDDIQRARAFRLLD